jgi:MFS family permease
MRSFGRPARLFLIATILDGAVYSVWWLFFNFYILERGFDREFMGLVTTAPSVAALVLGIPFGLLSDRLGRKRAMLLGVGVYVAAIAMEVTVLDPNLILLAAFLNGAGSTLYFLSQAPFMMKASTPENRTLLFSMNFGLITLSGAVGNLFAGQLPAFFGNLLGVPGDSAAAYQAVLLVAAALSSLTLIPLSLIRETQSATAYEQLPPVGEDTATGKTKAPTLMHTLTREITLKLAFPNLLIGFGAAILMPYMNVFFRDKFAITDQTLGILFSLSSLLTGFGTLIGPRLAEGKGGKIRAVVFTQGISLVFLFVLGFSRILGLTVIAFLVRGTLMNMAVPLYGAFAMEQVGESEQATVNSVKELAWSVGWAVGPYISGVVQESYGFTPLFILTGVLYAAAILLTWLFFRKND